jgi:hypothetical protein
MAHNWNGQGSAAPNEAAICTAQRVIDVLSTMPSLQPERIVGSADGGVTICFIIGHRYADIECFNSGEIAAVTSDRTGRPDVWEVSLDDHDIKLALERIDAFIQSQQAGKDAAEQSRA